MKGMPHAATEGQSVGADSILSVHASVGQRPALDPSTPFPAVGDVLPCRCTTHRRLGVASRQSTKVECALTKESCGSGENSKGISLSTRSLALSAAIAGERCRGAIGEHIAAERRGKRQGLLARKISEATLGSLIPAERVAVVYLLAKMSSAGADDSTK